jgi:lipopolysaccharide transport system ATP-binding protein
MSCEWAIRVRHLSKTYRVYDRPLDRGKQWIFPPLQKCLGWPPIQYYREVHALEDVSFEVKKGETLGIIGRNGSGKSTLLQLIVGTLSPTSGTIETNGRIAALLELGAGFHPEFTGRENVVLNATLLGLSQPDIDARLDDMLAFADIGAAIDQPVKTYSSGMVVRLAFAVMAHVSADILVIDEALAVGDAFFVQKCIRFLRAFMDQGTVLFVSHDSAAVLSLCRTALWMEQGRIAGKGNTKEICDGYLHEPTAEPSRQHVEEAVDAPRVPERKPAPQDVSKRPALTHPQSHGGPSGRLAWIESFSLLNTAGRSIHTVTHRERVRLRVCCGTSAGLASPIVGFLVRNRFGQSLFGANTYMAEKATDRAVAPGARFVAELEFLMPVLHPGDYAMSIALADGTQEEHVQHHWMHDALAFTSAPSEWCFGLIAVDVVRAQVSSIEPQDSRHEPFHDSIAL